MRTTAKHLTPALLLVSAATAAGAQETDTQLWGDARVSWTFDERTVGSLDFSPRYSRESVRDDVLLVRVNAVRKVNDVLSLGGGFAIVESDAPGRELRPHQDIILTFGKFALRNRLEQRLFDEGRPDGLRLRNALSTSVPLSERDSIAISSEVFFRLQRQGALHSGFEQVWGTVDYLHATTPNTQVGVGYRGIYLLREGRDAYSHVPRVIVRYRF